MTEATLNGILWLLKEHKEQLECAGCNDLLGREEDIPPHVRKELLQSAWRADDEDEERASTPDNVEELAIFVSDLDICNKMIEEVKAEIARVNSES